MQRQVRPFAYSLGVWLKRGRTTTNLIPLSPEAYVKWRTLGSGYFVSVSKLVRLKTVYFQVPI